MMNYGGDSTTFTNKHKENAMTQSRNADVAL